MLHYRKGDIFKETTAAIVNPVNTVGVMGKGLAKQFKTRYPGNYRAYAQACKAGTISPSNPLVFDLKTEAAPRFIINLPTKRHWRDNSRLSDIDQGLTALALILQSEKIPSITIPAIGAGLGNLKWEDVKAVIEKRLGHLTGTDITVLEPY